MDQVPFTLGFSRTYIRDYPFERLCTLPAEVAVAWVQTTCPEVVMAGSRGLAREITLDGNSDSDARVNGWGNKRFVLVAHEQGRWLALYNHDGVFSLYRQR